MPFPLPVGHKFACVCLINAGTDRILMDQSHDLGGDVWAIFSPPFEVDKHWRDWLGTVKIENLRQTSLTLLAHAQSNQPDILDKENETLATSAFGVFYGLFMTEIFHHNGAFVLKGANTGQGATVRQVADLQQHIMPNGVNPWRITMATLQRAAHIATGVGAIHSSSQHQRLQNGYRAWQRGLREYYGCDRLHQFVRAVEAVVKPEIGRTEALFIHRCQIFVRPSGTARAIFRDLYQLRSQTEHMNPDDSVLARYQRSEQQAKGLERAYQAQLLASNVYERILSTPSLHDVFDSDAHIDDFWRLPMDEQQAIWGNPIDLEQFTRSRFTTSLI